jgi:glutathione S-transferase
MAVEDTPQAPGWTIARDAAARYYQEMEALLADGREFLAGPYTFADIAFYMAQLFGARKGAPMTSSVTPTLVAWRDRVSARPAVRTVVGAMGRYLASIGRPVPGFVQAMV